MKWNKFTIKTITAAEDILSATLADFGVEGIQIEDKIPLSDEDKEKMFIDILPELPPDDGVAYVSFFLDEEADNTKIVQDIRNELEELRSFMDIGDGTIEESVTEDIDWMNNWKAFFKPFIVDDIYIKPTWEKETKEACGKKIIEIDPGTAFGTGKHETTQLCIRQLKKFILADSNILDIGCGSGILSIVSLKEGANHVDGIDVDENAIIVADENSKLNGLKRGAYNFEVGNLITDKKLQSEYGKQKYDIVVANILADTIISLNEVVHLCLKKGGVYISSGIIDKKEKDVIESVKKNGFEILEVAEQGDWRAIVARK